MDTIFARFNLSIEKTDSERRKRKEHQGIHNYPNVTDMLLELSQGSTTTVSGVSSLPSSPAYSPDPVMMTHPANGAS